jgi:hypothetical protein
MNQAYAQPARWSAPPLGPRGLLATARGFAGYALLPAVGLLSSGAGWEGTAAALLAPPAALLLSVPSLLVGHAWLRLSARPAALLQATAMAFREGGHLALGLTPLVALYAATSRLGPLLVVATLLGVGLLAIERGRRALNQAEAEVDAGLSARVRMGWLTLAWAAFALAVGARTGLDLLTHLFR